jgi:hypothetical protein
LLNSFCQRFAKVESNVLNNAFFSLTTTGVTFSELLGAVTFEFGTSTGEGSATGTLTNTQLIVPEPRSIAILLTGLLGLTAARRFRRARQSAVRAA